MCCRDEPGWRGALDRHRPRGWRAVLLERFDGEPGGSHVGSRVWGVRLGLLGVVIEFGELSFDIGQVALEGFGVAKGLPDALLGVGDGLLRLGQVAAGVVEDEATPETRFSMRWMSPTPPVRKASRVRVKPLRGTPSRLMLTSASLRPGRRTRWMSKPLMRPMEP